MISQLPPHRKLERLSITCPLGVRFQDIATGSMVAEGLRVAAFASANPERRVPVGETRSGVYALHGLPLLRDFEYSDDDESRWTNVAPIQFTMQVTDPLGRYLPLQFTVEAPSRVLDAAAGSPRGSGIRTVPLFSAPSRLLPGGFAAVRTELYELDEDSPSPRDRAASWAVAEVEAGNGPRSITMRGMADRQGRVTIVLPYPEAENVSPGSPPSNGPFLLSEQTWAVSFRAWHLFESETREFADLDRLVPLFERAPDEVWDFDSPLASFTGAELTFGRELVLPVRTEGDLRPRKLYITPAGSPA